MTRVLTALLALAVATPALGATTLVRNETKKVTLDATAGNVEQINIPAKCRYLLMYFETNAGWYDDAATDGGAKTADAIPFPADTWISWRVPTTYGSRKNTDTVSVYLASAANSGIVYLYATEDGA